MRTIALGNFQSGNPHFETGLVAKEIGRIQLGHLGVPGYTCLQAARLVTSIAVLPEWGGIRLRKISSQRQQIGGLSWNRHLPVRNFIRIRFRNCWRISMLREWRLKTVECWTDKSQETLNAEVISSALISLNSSFYAEECHSWIFMIIVLRCFLNRWLDRIQTRLSSSSDLNNKVVFPLRWRICSQSIRILVGKTVSVTSDFVRLVEDNRISGVSGSIQQLPLRNAPYMRTQYFSISVSDRVCTHRAIMQIVRSRFLLMLVIAPPLLNIHYDNSHAPTERTSLSAKVRQRPDCS